MTTKKCDYRTDRRMKQATQKQYIDWGFFQYDRIFSNISKCIYIVMKLVYGKAFLGHFLNFQWIIFK